MKRDWHAAAERVMVEGPLRVCDAAKLIPAARGRRGHCSASTVVRWIKHGKKGVLLDGVMLGGTTWHTSLAALARFGAALSALESGQALPALPLAGAARRAEAAGRELAERLRRRRKCQLVGN